MVRNIDIKYTKELIDNNFNSISDFCRYIEISRSHFDGIMKNEINIGKKTLEKFNVLIPKYISSVEELLEPIPILIGDLEIKEILITDKDDYVIASINSQNIISDKRYKVEYILKG